MHLAKIMSASSTSPSFGKAKVHHHGIYPSISRNSSDKREPHRNSLSLRVLGSCTKIIREGPGGDEWCGSKFLLAIAERHPKTSPKTEMNRPSPAAYHERKHQAQSTSNSHFRKSVLDTVVPFLSKSLLVFPGRHCTLHFDERWLKSNRTASTSTVTSDWAFTASSQPLITSNVMTRVLNYNQPRTQKQLSGVYFDRAEIGKFNRKTRTAAGQTRSAK